MPPSTASVTITGTTGPDVDVVAKVFPNIRDIKIDFPRNVITLTNNQGVVSDYDYAITATLTFVIAAGNAVITIA